MLFSNTEVAKFIEETFEPVWVSVRPAPLVTIDFGNGHKVVRTLQGNVATYVCGADGSIYDVLPGIYTPKPYREQLTLLADLVKDHAQRSEAERTSELKKYHLARAAALKQPVAPAVAAAGRIGGMGKGGIGGGLGGGPMGIATNQPVGIEGPLEAVLAGRPVVAATPPGGDLAARPDLAFDVQVNETFRRRLVHERLATLDHVQPDDLKKWLFRVVLTADLDDPYLGLGPVLNTGYPFGIEDEAAGAKGRVR